MEILQLFFTTVMIVSAIAVLGFLDKKYQLGLSSSSVLTSNSEQNYHDSHITRQFEKELKAKDNSIKNLQERVHVLEQIVTDPKEQLLREINNLK